MNNEVDALFGEIQKVNEDKSVELEDITFQLVPRSQGPFREKYRPQKIEEIVPTCSIELLRNQIDNPNASSIFLFEGESGTGKTTCARILAKAKVCQANNTQLKPCLKCDACKEFENSFDKWELNAADKNRIEDIRALIEDMKYGPAVYKKKIYILDEVQRLTPAAQQVLLAELEDGYSYILVFLCTTDIKEINKALADRACKITFNKLTPKYARQIVNQIAKHEKLTIPEDIFESLYLQAKGSIRALLNNIQAFSQNGFNPDAWPEDEVTNEINHFYKLITSGDWTTLAKTLAKPEVRKEPETFRFGLENYMRAVILKTPNLNEAQKLGSAMIRLQGSMINLPLAAQYNEFVLKCLRATAVYG